MLAIMRRTGLVTVRRSLVAVLCAWILCAPARATADPGPAGSLLDVPYLAQPVRLCGGAAVAMVQRYWGDRQAVPQDFAGLVDATRGGIPADRLAPAVSSRGWQAFPAVADQSSGLDRLRTEVDRGRPVVVLLEASPTTYHYVVTVGVTDQSVVFHDPARAPFQVMPRADFDAAWAKAERWMLLVLPKAGGARAPAAPARSAAARSAVTPSATATPSGAAASSPCASLVSQGVTAAREGHTAEADRRLTAATSLCPDDAAGWRELAGLRFLARNYQESARLAARAVGQSSTDRHAWQILATSRYLNGDFAGALEAWNRVGEPRTNVVEVNGASRTPHTVVLSVVELTPRDVLTADAYRRANRRLDELPVASEATLTYEPIQDGQAKVAATIDERTLVPDGWMDWAAWGVETLFMREIKMNVPGHLGAGENLQGRYRWAANRPRVRLDFSVPAPGVVPGLATIDFLWERQSYRALTPEADAFREERRRAGGYLSDWIAGWLRWQAGAAIDHIGGRRHVAVSAQTQTEFLDDRVNVTAAVEHWMPDIGDAFTSRSIGAAWRWTPDRARPNWIARVGFGTVSASAPLAVWHGAGSSSSRGGFLRAHSSTDRGIVTGDVLGRRVLFGTIEHQRPVWSSSYGVAALALFVDTARAWERREPEPSPWHTDVGAGVRFGEADATGLIRVDLAVGLRDRRVKLSAGYTTAWGQ